MLVAVRRLPVGEASIAAGLLILALAAVGLRPLLVGIAWLAIVTPRLVAIDVGEHRLPDAIVLRGYPLVGAAVVADAWLHDRSPGDALLGGAGYGVLILALHVLGGMGFGDVKLAPLLGMLASAVVPGGAVVAVVLAFLVGGLAATVVLLRSGPGSRLAFGPPMLLGAWAAILLLA